MKTKITITQHKKQKDTYKVSVAFSHMNHNFRGKGDIDSYEKEWTAQSVSSPEIYTSRRHIYLPGTADHKDGTVVTTPYLSKKDAVEAAKGIKQAIINWRKEVEYAD